MKKNSLFFLVSIFFISVTASAHAIPGEVSSKVCSATTKVCVSNVTNKLTAKDEELLQACKDCCSASQINTPSSVKGAFKGCTPRCNKSCEKAYKKEIAKINKKG